MAVVDFRLLVFLEPLEQLALRADLIGREARAFLGQFALQIRVLTQDLRGAARVAKEIAQQLLVNRRPHAYLPGPPVLHAETILGRVGRRGDQPMVLGFLDQHVQVKQRRRFQDGISPREVSTVPGERVVFPQMLAEPRGTAHRRAPGGVFAGRGVAPRIGDHVRHPAARVVIRLGRARARGHEGFDQLEHRLVQFRQVARLGRPVVHLHVDI